MHFLINELAFIKQAQNIYEADRLIQNMFGIIQEIKSIQGSDPLLTHSSLSNCNLADNLTFFQWIQQKLKSSNSNERTLASVLIRLIRQGPFIDTQGFLEGYRCYFNNQDISSSSVAGAAYLKGILISLQNAPEFIDEYINIQFGVNEQDLQEINIDNLTTLEQARKLCPRYKSIPKHEQGGWGTLMDLKDEEVQQVLNQSIEHGKQRYSYYRGKFYEFKSDNTLNELGYPTYHGYPVNESEVPSDVKQKLSRQKTRE